MKQNNAILCRIVKLACDIIRGEKVYGSTIIRNLWNVQPFDKRENNVAKVYQAFWV